MEAIIAAIVTGLFGLAGIWYRHYLEQHKSAAGQASSEAAGPEPRAPKPTPAKRAESARTPTAERTKEFVFYREGSWWIGMVVIILLSVAGALFAGWLAAYLSGVLAVDFPLPDGGWTALGIAGAVWGIVYSVIGGLGADDWVEMFFPLVGPYENIFSPSDAGDFFRGLLSAPPVNILVGIAAAMIAGIAAENFLGADLAGVFYLAFGLTVFVGIVWYATQEAW
ncbi:MAG: hypothetical protein JW929_11370 [Anaerolineales bacterium]|nr:hypothetical protein [Anaerolineales bacterium]